MMPTITITGGTGMIGTVLGQSLLKKGYKVIVLSRANEKKKDPAISYAAWDAKKHFIEQWAIEEADHIIHLAGANIAEQRWTDKRKKEIVDSRVDSGKFLVENLNKISNKVKTLVSASAIGWYGSDPVVPNPEPFREDAPAHSDFLGNTCKQWEASVEPVVKMGIRLVKIRTGIVLSSQGGALQEFVKPLKWGIASILGNGKQVVSWVDIRDLADMYIAAIENENMNGAYNAVAPDPVTNRELVMTLAKARGKFYIPFRVPAFVLKAMIGEMSIEVLKSTTVSADKILSTGFVFKYPTVADALRKET